MLGHRRGCLAPEKLKLAMAIEGKNRHTHWNGIRRRHWLATAKRCGLPGIENLIGEIIERTPQVLDDVRQRIPKGFPSAIADPILDGVAAATRRLQDDIAN